MYSVLLWCQVSVQPQLVLLQSDRANRNGDPDGDTLAKLGDTTIYRTDDGGTLHLWTDGARLWAQPERASTN
jgi:beta-lactamase superfamily II metal-dependent hydrolase